MKIALLAAATGALLLAPAANAAINIYVSQSGADVFAQAIGTLNLTGLSSGSAVTDTPYVRGYYSAIATGVYGAQGSRYFGIAGPDYITSASSPTPIFTTFVGTGDAFGIAIANHSVFVPQGYVSGAAIASTATFLSQTLASLQIDVGTYVFTTPSDTITLHIGEAAPAAVPEPATWAMFIGGFGMIGGAMRRRQRTTVSFA
jgi:hypothetical protein